MQRNQNIQNNLKKKNHIGGLTLTDFKTYHTTTWIKMIYN